MKKVPTITALISLLSTISIAFAAEPAQRVLMNATIETMNPDQPIANAIAISDGIVVYVGGDEGVREYIDADTDVIDLAGKYVTPGLIESHNHVIASTWLTDGVDTSAATSPEEVAQILKDYADENPDQKVIVGNGWVPGRLENNLPTAAHLDAMGIDRPVIAIGNFCHDAALNSVALDMAGINSESAVDMQPGVTYWDRDDNGRITGLAIEMQYAQAYIDIGAWNPETMIPEAIDYLQGFLASQGVTTAQTPGIISPGVIISAEAMKRDMRDIMAILHERADNGRAQMRLSVLPIFKTPDADPADIVGFAGEMRERYNDDMLWTRGIKIHPELAWQSRGTTQLAPYLPAYEGEPPTWGQFGVTPDRIWEVVQRANREGLDVVTHSDGAHMSKVLVDATLHSLKSNPDARNRLDHITFMDAATRARVVENNIGLNATPMFANEFDVGPGGDALYAVVDKDYAYETYGSYSDLAYSSRNLSLSGDHPGTTIDRAYPVYLMQQAMTLVEPSIDGANAFPPWRKKMTIDQVLAAYTTVPAWQLRMEDKIGSIEVGKYADVAIFSKSLREIAPQNLIADGKVVGTILNGEFTHRDGI